MTAAIRNFAALFFVALALSACVSTGPAVEPGKATVDDINRLSGLDASVDAARRGMNDASGQLSGTMPAAARAKFNAAARDAFNPQRMRVSIRQRMQGCLSQADLAALAEFYASPVGRRVTTVEIRAARQTVSVASAQAAIATWRNVQASDPQRAALYRRVIASTRMEQRVTMIVDASMDSMVRGMTTAIGDPEFTRILRPLMATYRAEARRQLPAMLNAGVAASYKSLSMEDLRAYAAFLETPAGRRYYAAATNAIGATLSAEAQRFGASLGHAIKQ